MTTYEGAAPSGQREARSASTLVFGILSLVLAGCAPVGLLFGCMAINRSAAELDGMRDGTIDPTDRGMVKAGRVCGIIGTVFSSLSMLYWLLHLALLALALFSAAASGP